MYINFILCCIILLCKSKSFSSILFKAFQQLGIAVFLPTMLEALDKHISEGTVVEGISLIPAQLLELVLLSSIGRNTARERALPLFSLWLIMVLTEGGRELICHRHTPSFPEVSNLEPNGSRIASSIPSVLVYI